MRCKGLIKNPSIFSERILSLFSASNFWINEEDEKWKKIRMRWKKKKKKKKEKEKKKKEKKEKKKAIISEFL